MHLAGSSHRASSCRQVVRRRLEAVDRFKATANDKLEGQSTGLFDATVTARIGNFNHAIGNGNRTNC